MRGGDEGVGGRKVGGIDNHVILQLWVYMYIHIRHTCMCNCYVDAYISVIS